MNQDRLNRLRVDVLPRLDAFLGQGGYSHKEFRDELTVTVPSDRIVDVIGFLRDDDTLRFSMLKDVCVVDWNRRSERFEIIYNLWSIPHSMRLRVTTTVEERNPHVESVVSIFPSANWYEREAYDMHGIVFDGHPDLRRMYMPEDYVDPVSGEPIYPLRKEVPLMGIPSSLPLPDRNQSNQI